MENEKDLNKNMDNKKMEDEALPDNYAERLTSRAES